jgi:hypothetical protein
MCHKNSPFDSYVYERGEAPGSENTQSIADRVACAPNKIKYPAHNLVHFVQYKALEERYSPTAGPRPGRGILNMEKALISALKKGKASGPGLLTGAADDDASGIATYSKTGAQFGFGQP